METVLVCLLILTIFMKGMEVEKKLQQNKELSLYNFFFDFSVVAASIFVILSITGYISL